MPVMSADDTSELEKLGGELVALGAHARNVDHDLRPAAVAVDTYGDLAGLHEGGKTGDGEKTLPHREVLRQAKANLKAADGTSSERSPNKSNLRYNMRRSPARRIAEIYCTRLTS